MTRCFIRRGVSLAAVTALLAGCASSPALRIYELGDQSAPAIGVWSEAGLPVIELKTVAVPDYLDSSDILRRVGANELVPSPAGRWGERLSAGLTHALASALSRQLPQMVVITTPALVPTRRIFVEIERFDIGADGQCLVAARWRITAGDGQTMVKSDHATVSETAGSLADDPAVAAAMTRAVGHLAERITATL